MSEFKNPPLKYIDFENFQKENVEFSKIFEQFKIQAQIKMYVNIYTQSETFNYSHIFDKIKLCYFFIEKSINTTSVYSNHDEKEYGFFGSVDMPDSEYKYNYIIFSCKKIYNSGAAIILNPVIYLSPSIDYCENILAGLNMHIDLLEYQKILN